MVGELHASTIIVATILTCQVELLHKVSLESLKKAL